MTKPIQDVTVNAVEVRRNAGQAIRFFTTLRDAALDTGRGRSEATIAAAAAVRRLFPDVDFLAALGLAPEAAQGAAGAGAGGDDADSASSHPEADEAAGDGSLPPRSRDRNRLFADLTGAEIGPDLGEALDRLAELWDREPDAPREAGDDEFVDDDSLRAAGVDLRFASFFAAALAREERFTADGWNENPELDHGHGAARIAMLSPDFIDAVNDFYDLAATAGYIRDHAGRRPGRTLDTSTPSGIAAGVLLGLEYVPAGDVIGRDGTAYHRKAHFVAPGAAARRGLRAV